MLKTAKKTFFVTFLMLCCSSFAYASSSPVLLASIKPVAMLVKEVAGEKYTVEALLPTNASPHDYALKFSDLRAIKEADYIVWVGPELESLLVKTLKTVPAAKQLRLTEVEGMRWPEQSAEGHDHHDHGHHHDTHDHESSDSESLYKDPHLWLNPYNSVISVQRMAVLLGEKYPADKAFFEANAQIFAQKMKVLDETVRAKMNIVQDRGFVVVHDGYRHFVDHYGLSQLSSIRLASGANRGTKHYGDIMALGSQVACVFTEPQLSKKGAIQIADKLGAQHAALDFMGAEIALKKDSYLQFFNAFAGTFVDCLSETKGSQ